MDYALFIILLLVSLVVGFYYAWKDRNQSADSFLLNNDSMNAYGAGLSVFVSALSALTIIGFPGQVRIIYFGLKYVLKPIKKIKSNVKCSS